MEWSIRLRTRKQVSQFCSTYSKLVSLVGHGKLVLPTLRDMIALQ